MWTGAWEASFILGIRAQLRRALALVHPLSLILVHPLSLLSCLPALADISGWRWLGWLWCLKQLLYL